MGPARICLVAVVTAAMVEGGIVSRASAEQVNMTCDAFLIAPDGTIGPTPVRSDQTGFFTMASAVTPTGVRPGERFTVSIPSETLTLASFAGEFPVLSQSDLGAAPLEGAMRPRE
jgi:hypothetical protein